jgi:hypothetical protein
MKGFLTLLSYNLIAFGFVLLIAVPVVIPLFSRVFVGFYTGHWEAWSETFDGALWAASKGLILTPSIAFAMTVFEHGVCRGWWRG